MIELIFVIIILGILAAVAIPKLTATRNDAEIAEIAMSIGTSCIEIIEYTVSQGGSATDVTLMSNSAGTLVRTGKARVENNGRKMIVVAPSNVDCVELEIITNGNNDDLNVSYVTSQDALCLELQGRVDKVQYSVPIRGESIIY